MLLDVHYIGIPLYLYPRYKPTMLSIKQNSPHPLYVVAVHLANLNPYFVIKNSVFHFINV